MPTTTSSRMPRCLPFWNRYPRLAEPMITPTETSAIVLTETTRMPASSTGPASGNSTRKNRAAGEKPMALEASRVESDTELRASEAERAMIATP